MGYDCWGHMINEETKCTRKHDSRDVRNIIGHVVVDQKLMKDIGAGCCISDTILLLTQVAVTGRTNLYIF